MMRKGQKVTVEAPPELCFGDKGGMIGQGMCPPGKGLFLEVELLDINEALMAYNMRLARERKEIERSEQLEKAILEKKQRDMWKEANPGAKKDKKEKKEKKEKKRKKVESSSSSD